MNADRHLPPPVELEPLVDSRHDAREARSVSSPMESVPPEKPTARQELAKYWGARWPEIEASMVAAGENLETPFELVPWEQVAGDFESLLPLEGSRRAALVRSLVKWPSDRTGAELGDWIETEFDTPSGVEIDGMEAEMLSMEAQPHNDVLESMADDYVNLLNAHLRHRWAAGDFLKAPFSTRGLAGTSDLYTSSHATSGWSIVVAFNGADYPDLLTLRKEVSRRRAERNHAIELRLRQRGYFGR